MTIEDQGLRVTRDLITTTTQWRLLLLLARGPQSTWELWCQLPPGQRLKLIRAGWHLWRKELVMFHVKQRCWTLSWLGESLRPILQQILTCQREETK